MPGYSVPPSLLNCLDLNRYLCSKCELLLKDPVLPCCGHRLCKSCADGLPAPAKCPRQDCKKYFVQENGETVSLVTQYSAHSIQLHGLSDEPCIYYQLDLDLSCIQLLLLNITVKSRYSDRACSDLLILLIFSPVHTLIKNINSVNQLQMTLLSEKSEIFM